jgi:hypothetical protein
MGVFLAIVSGLLLGLLIGRWWALLTAPLVGLILYSLDGSDLAGLAFFWGTVVAAASLAVGVGTRKSREAARPPSSPS